MKGISIVIPTYNCVKGLKICLESIYKNQYNSKNEVVVIVDGTEPLIKPILDEFKDRLNLKTIIFDENQGLAMATNYGFFGASNELCLNINDDNVVPYHFDKILQEDYEMERKYHGYSDIILTPNQIERKPSIFNPFIIEDMGDLDRFDLEKFTKRELEIRDDYKEGVNIGWTFPIFMSKKLFMSLGGFDLLFGSSHVIDLEFFMKAENVGVYNLRTYNCNFYHFGSQTARTEDSYQKENNAHLYFENKWGFRAYNKLLQNQ